MINTFFMIVVFPTIVLIWLVGACSDNFIKKLVLIIITGLLIINIFSYKHKINKQIIKLDTIDSEIQYIDAYKENLEDELIKVIESYTDYEIKGLNLRVDSHITLNSFPELKGNEIYNNLIHSIESTRFEKKQLITEYNETVENIKVYKSIPVINIFSKHKPTPEYYKEI